MPGAASEPCEGSRFSHPGVVTLRVRRTPHWKLRLNTRTPNLCCRLSQYSTLGQSQPGGSPSAIFHLSKGPESSSLTSARYEEMDPAGIALGAVALIVPAYQACEIVYRKFKDFRKYSNDIEEDWRRFRQHRSLFHLVRRAMVAEVVGVEKAGEMLGDSKHPMWKHHSVENWCHESMNGVIGESITSCK